jgi:LPS sulfotransferase NodH
LSLGNLFSKVIEKRSRRVQTKAIKTLLICSLPRSGSNLLADALASTNLCGMPLEYLNSEYELEFRDGWNLSPKTSVLFYLEEALKRTTTQNGIFGLKIHWHQFSNLLIRLFPGRTAHESITELSYIFPDIRYIFLSRRDKVRQAVSYARALQTNIWWRIDGVRDPQERCVEPHYDFEQIAMLLKKLNAYEASWEDFFSKIGVTPLRLIYEDLVPCDAAQSVLDFMGNSTSMGELPAPRLRRQADEISEQWALIFRRSMDL